MKSEPLHILLVEDDEIDKETILRGLKQSDLPITAVSTGNEALNVLRGQAGYPRLPRPYIILLDLSLPGMNGLEFLQALRHDPDLKYSIVFVLTNSSRDTDQLAAYNQIVAGYVLKSVLDDAFLQFSQLLKAYKFLVEFPPGVG